MSVIAPRTARRVAYLAAGANLVAAGLMALVLRLGLPPREVAVRAEWVADNLALWRIGWLSWHVAAATLLALLIVLANRWREEAPLLCPLAVALATAGLAADLGAEVLLMGRLPGGPEDFELVQAISLLLTGFVANGLYTAAGILLTVAGRQRLPRELLWLAVPVWGAGIALSAATLADSIPLTVVATAVLMPLFVIWTVLLGRWLGSGDAS